VKENIVRSTRKPLTPAQRREIAALAAMPDDAIDFSDIPEVNEKFWANAVRNPFYDRMHTHQAAGRKPSGRAEPSTTS
jgi:hypothetical protein